MIRGTNFALIENDKQLKSVFEAGIVIEDLIEFSEHLTLIKERYFLEKFAEYLLCKSGFESKPKEALAVKLARLRNVLDSGDLEKLHLIQKAGNRAVHEGKDWGKDTHKKFANELFIILKKYIRSEKKLSQSQVNTALDKKYFATYLGKNEIESIVDTKCEYLEYCLKNERIDKLKFEQFQFRFSELEQKVVKMTQGNELTEDDLRLFIDSEITGHLVASEKQTEDMVASSLRRIHELKNSFFLELSKLERRVGKLEISLEALDATAKDHENRLTGLEESQSDTYQVVYNLNQDIIAKVDYDNRQNHSESRQHVAVTVKNSSDRINENTKKVVQSGVFRIIILISVFFFLGVSIYLFLRPDSPTAVANTKIGEVVNDISGKVISIRKTDKDYLFITIETKDGLISIPIFDTKKISDADTIEKGDTLSISGEFGIYEGQKQIKPSRNSDLVIEKRAKVSPTEQGSSEMYEGKIIDKYVHNKGHIFLTVKSADDTLEVPLFVTINPDDRFEIGDTIVFSGEENYYKGKKEIIPKTMSDIRLK